MSPLVETCHSAASATTAAPARAAASCAQPWPRTQPGRSHWPVPLATPKATPAALVPPSSVTLAQLACWRCTATCGSCRQIGRDQKGANGQGSGTVASHAAAHGQRAPPPPDAHCLQAAASGRAAAVRPACEAQQVSTWPDPSHVPHALSPHRASTPQAYSEEGARRSSVDYKKEQKSLDDRVADGTRRMYMCTTCAPGRVPWQGGSGSDRGRAGALRGVGRARLAASPTPPPSSPPSPPRPRPPHQPSSRPRSR